MIKRLAVLITLILSLYVTGTGGFSPPFLWADEAIPAPSTEKAPGKETTAIDLIPRTYPIGGFPRATSLVDLDYDGDLDIVVTNPDNHNIVILLNKGNGTFETGNNYPPAIPIDGYPIAIISKDIDNDSDPDLVVLDSDGLVRPIFNNGEFRFSYRGSYTVDVYPFSISTSDLDMDGDWDIIVSSARKNTILLNDGKGGFNTSLTYRGSADSHVRITTDLNLDERDDMVIGEREGISVLLKNGDNTYARGVYYGTGKMPIAVVAGDLNSDLYPDLIVANYKGQTISILKNNGDGSFQEPVNYPSGKGPNSLSLGDIDRDKDIDIVVTNGLSGDITIFINNTVRPLTVTTTSLPQGHRGVYYETRLEAGGGLPPYRWEVASGTLPPTLHLDPLTGEIVSMSRHGDESEGIPAPPRPLEGEEEGEPLLSLGPPCYCLNAPKGLYRFTVQVTDSASTIATADLYIEVLPRSGMVLGKINYVGEKRGAIRIGLWPQARLFGIDSFIGPLYYTTIPTPAEYKIDNVYPESYLASAYLDVNGDGIKQRDEPYGRFRSGGSAGKSEFIVVDDGAEMSGIDIEIVDSK